jgi:dipeptidyl aminopeptidase/acylaminoacyl peptidase
MKQRMIAAVACAALWFAATAAAQEIPIEDFVRDPSYSGVKISPDGAHLAMTVERGKKDALAVLRTADLGVVSVTDLPGEWSVGAFAWGNHKRLVFSTYVKQGRFIEQTTPFGLLYAIDIDGSKPRLLFDRPSTMIERGARSTWTDREGFYRLVDALSGDDEHVLVEIFNPFASQKDMFRLARLNIESARAKILATPPRRYCNLAIDGAKAPRFAMCRIEDEDSPAADDGATDLFRRDDEGRWTMVGAFADGGVSTRAIGNADGGSVYAMRDDARGTYEFGTLSAEDGSFSPLFRDPVSDPAGYLTSPRDGTVFAVMTQAGRPKIHMLDVEHADADLYASLASAFPEKLVELVDASRDGRYVVFSVRSDRDPGELYLHDRQTGKARFLMRRMKWIEPDRMATVRPFRIVARDGVALHGYLTVPKGSNGRNLPMVVNVHGGPMGIRDDWRFDPENQLLASRGYLVLQVNFRGSGGFGRDFERKAYGEWHDDIVDDIVDATRWAIAEGHADKDRICIYGGSFGGYAAMMVPAREQGLFKCAFGYVGAYDAEIQLTSSDTSQFDAGRRYIARALGATKAERAEASPVNHADKIRIPVYLVAGAADRRCPPRNTEAMRDALIAAGNPPEGVIIQADEGHGFYKPENKLKLYTELLGFLGRHIGGKS